jgi:NAD(P)-dependent dehydrogenase (short-subunit alcohol dehydrogenase family)
MSEGRDPFSMRDEVVIVTGGSGLYGRPISEALAAAGASVVVASRDIGSITSLADDLQAGGSIAWAHQLDLEDEASIDGLCSDVLRRYGRIDVLINNAVSRAGSHPFETSMLDFERTNRVNGAGLFQITRRCAAAMVEAQRGSIVNVASIYGSVGPDFSVYGDTGMTTAPTYAYDKGGLISLTRYLATYLGPKGVRCNCLIPGGLETDQDERFVSAYCQRTPLRRMATVEDIKGPIVFLASDASRYVTGALLPVDGGWTAM